MAEAKSILAGVQKTMVARQIEAYLDQEACCPLCGKRRLHKGHHPRTYRTLCGKLWLRSVRLYHCDCHPQTTKTFSPLSHLLPEHTAPELLYLESKFAALMSYGLSVRLLQEVLPIGQALNPATVRNHVHTVAQRIDAELGDEQLFFIDGCERDWEGLPRPDMPLTVGLDGGYVHSCAPRSRKHGWFEVIAGKSVTDDGASKRFAFVQNYDEKPKRRVFEVFKSQGMQMNQQVTFLSDGADTVRDLQLYLNPNAEHILDWFHVTMRITVMRQMAKGLGPPGSEALFFLSCYRKAC
jgi:DNA-directed RNA polymerase subunit RPC12/RpoP